MPDPVVIITDVDNTLYDWVHLWAGAFGSLVAALTRLTGVGVEEWIRAARAVHVRRGATECPSLLAEMADSALWPLRLDASRVLPPAAAAYRDYWDHHLAPYPGMRESLTALAARGHTVVAYTEGDVSIAASRLARMGLAGVIRRVFGRAALPTPANASHCLVGASRHVPIAVDFIPRDDVKPNTAGLGAILARCGTTGAGAVYVGDSLWKDVGMAKSLGMPALWAHYGTVRDSSDAALLDRVGHWPAADVARERQATPADVRPDAILEHPSELVDVVGRMTIAPA